MRERFEEIFEQVQVELDLDWWELYDSDKFDKVVALIVAEFGEEVLESEEYSEWENEMYWDLLISIHFQKNSWQIIIAML